MKKLSMVFILVAVMLSFGGCAKYWNNVAADGGMFGSYKADYIVRNDSGGVIMDVWKLKDVIVQSESQSDGWLFQDEEGNVIHLGGDVKVIRLNSGDKAMWNRYIEFHAEFESVSYQEKVRSSLGLEK